MKHYLLVLSVVILFFTGTKGWYLPNDEEDSGVSPEYDITSLFSQKKIDWKEINKTISFVKTVFDRMQTREKILGYADIKIEPGTPSHGLFVDNFPEPEATEIMKDTLEVVAASAQIAYQYCTAEMLTNEECGNKLKQIKLWNTALQKSCQKLGKDCTKEQIYSKYRSMDSSCNHEEQGEKGQSFTVYGRLLYPDYLGGIKEPRRSVTKEELPSARIVSESLRLEGNVDKKRTLAVLFWGQFLEHDLSHTAMSKMVHTGKPIECCDPDGRSFSPRYEHPFCMPIVVSSRDEYYADRDVSCLSYTRSIPAVGPDCAMGPMEQINQATHFLDGSQIYGTTKAKNDILRNFTEGLMAVIHVDNHTILQISKDPSNDCQQGKFNEPCFKSGDTRVNTVPHINALYTIWVREHNRIASQLVQMNPDWDDEVVFQEARRIVIAEMQHITYNEWIPAVLGVGIHTEHKLSKDPLVSNEFATAAIRALQYVSIGKLTLTDQETIYTYHHKNMDSLLNEMFKNKYSGRELYHIGKPKDITYGYDLLSIDIQRGRDHGLQTYIEYRKYCGLNEIHIFEDLENVMLPKVVQTLKKTYKNVEDIDLIVGGLAETAEDGIFGPTISCILREQFERTKNSDRYFYTNKDQPMPFSESQLKEIKNVTFARIICDNSDGIVKISPRVFETISESNSQEIICDSSDIPKLNLSRWSSDRYTYTLSS